MANIKVSALEELTNIANDDYIVVNDTSLVKTKIITKANLFSGIVTNATDSGNDVIISQDLRVNNEVIAGGDISTTGDISFGTLTDNGEGITIVKFVDQADGIASNDSDIYLATTAAIIDYVNNGITGEIKIDGTQVLDSRKTGWTAATGTATRSTFATSTVTTAQLAERVKALIDDLIAHGLIGS